MLQTVTAFKVELIWISVPNESFHSNWDNNNIKKI